MTNLLKTSLLSAILVGTAITAVPASGATTGMAVIGLSAFSEADTDLAADALQTCRPNQRCEIAFLAYSFGDFRQPERLIRRVLPRFSRGESLVVTIYLDDGANRDNQPSYCWFRRNVNADNFWRAVRADDRTLKADWQNQVVRPAAAFVTNMQAWARSSNYTSRLRFVIVPVLEDGNNGSNVAGSGYQRLIDWTKPYFASNFDFRRSTTAKTAPRLPGIEMELHQTSLSNLIGGDTVTADGVKDGQGYTNDNEWIAFQISALNRSISALFWWPSFNGDRSRGAPWQRGVLKPFTSDRTRLDRARRIIAARP